MKESNFNKQETEIIKCPEFSWDRDNFYKKPGSLTQTSQSSGILDTTWCHAKKHCPSSAPASNKEPHNLSVTPPPVVVCAGESEEKGKTRGLG